MITRQSQPVQTNLHAGIAARCRLKNGFAFAKRRAAGLAPTAQYE